MVSESCELEKAIALSPHIALPLGAQELISNCCWSV